MTTLIFSNEEMYENMKTFKLLKDTCLLIKSVSLKQLKANQKKKLGDSLIRNSLTGKNVKPKITGQWKILRAGQGL